MQKTELNNIYNSTFICYVDIPTTYPHYIITAWNPYSEQVAIEQNRAANIELEALLQSPSKLTNYGKCIGSSRFGEWQEESYWVTCLNEEMIKSLGRTYKQNAIYKAKSPYDIQVIWLC